MTDEIREYIRNLRLEGKTMELGSRFINGSVKEFFDHYIGVDMEDGINVDVIANGHDLPFGAGEFDNVLCLEMLEHDDAFWQTAKELKRVLRWGGTLIVTVPGISFPRHDYPNDYWRFTTDGLKALFSDLVYFDAFEQNGTVYGKGTK